MTAARLKGVVCSQSELSLQEIRSKVLHESYHSKQLTTSDAVSLLGFGEGSAGICDHMLVSGFIELGKDSYYSRVARIGIQNIWTAKSWKSQDGC